jgi:hypothetical protein
LNLCGNKKLFSVFPSCLISQPREIVKQAANANYPFSVIDFGLWQSQKTAEVGIAGISGIAVYCHCHACQSGNPAIKQNHLKWEGM